MAEHITLVIQALVYFADVSSLKVFTGHLMCAGPSEGNKGTDKVCSLTYTVAGEMRQTPDTHRLVAK